jgi:purine-binding chemotaxis protein CheW
MAKEAQVTENSDKNLRQLVTMHVDGQLVGLAIESVHDVFNVQRITQVPRAPESVVGLVNLRGRVVTLLCLRSLLGFPSIPIQSSAMAVGVEWRDEAFGLVIDRIGDVIAVNVADSDVATSKIDRRLSGLCVALHKLPDGLIIELSLAALLERPFALAA